MAITQLNRGPDAGQIFGRKLGEGIESGVELLLNKKLADMQKEKMGDVYEKLGYPREFAYVEPAFARQQAKGIDALRESQRMGEAEAPFLDELAQRYNQALGTDFLSAGLLKTKQGKDLADQLLASKLKNEQIEAKAAAAPLTIGEAFRSAFGYTPERIKKQKTVLEKIGAKKKVKSQDIFTPEEINKMKQNGVDPEEVAKALQKEFLQSTQSEQSATQQEEARKEAASEAGEPTQEQTASLGQLLSSGLVGLGKGAASVTTPFMGQTLVQGGIGLTNLLGRLSGYGNVLPSYEQIQKNMAETPSERLRAIEEGFASPSFLAQQGAADLAEMGGAALPPSSEQVINPLLESAVKGTSAEKYVIPQTEGQQQAEDVASLAALAYKNVPGLAGKATEGAKALAKSFGSNVANWMTKAYTGSEDLGNAVGIGTFIASTVVPGSFKKMAEDKYAKVQNEIMEPAMREGKKINFNSYGEELDKVEKSARTFRPNSPERTAIESSIGEIKELMDPKGSVSPEALWNNVRSQNQNYKHIPPLARNKFKKITQIQYDAIEDFGKKYNPNAAKALKEGNAIWRTMNENAATRKNIISHIPLRRLGPAALAWMAGVPLPAIIGTAGGAYAVATMKQALKNPAIRSDIWRLAKAGAANDAAVINKLTNKLDRDMKKENPTFYSFMEQHKDRLIQYAIDNNA